MNDRPAPDRDPALNARVDSKIRYFLVELLDLVETHGARVAFCHTNPSISWVRSLIAQARETGGDAALDSLTRRLRVALEALDISRADYVAADTAWRSRCEEVRRHMRAAAAAAPSTLPFPR